jgi:hypothetical protein
MTTTLEAIFDGTVLWLQQPLPLPPQTRVRITINAPIQTSPAVVSFLQTARSLQLQGPADWSERIEEYLLDEKTSDNA